MIIKRKQFKPSYFAMILGSLVAIAILVFVLEKSGIINLYSPGRPATGPTEAQIEEQQQTEQKQKKSFIEADNSVAPSTSDTKSSVELTARQELNGNITVLAKLYGISEGDCSLTITNGSKTYSKVVPIIYQPDFSSCAGYSVQKDELGAGEWSIKLTPTANPSLEKTITSKVN